MTKPKHEVGTAQSANAHLPSAAAMGRRHQITEARLEALYRAVIEMRGGHDAELEKAFKGDDDGKAGADA